MFLLLQLDDGDRRVAGRLGCLLRDGPAERLVVDELGDRRMVPAHRAVRVLADLHLAVGHLQRVVDHQPAEQRLADAGTAGASHDRRCAGSPGASGWRHAVGHAAVAGGLDPLRRGHRFSCLRFPP